jgi:flagellar protein FlgJ
MPTAPVNNASVYGDFAGLEKLKSGAARSDPTAVRQVAQQFESLFARMMIKSMRAAIGRDPIFGSDQAQTYQNMFDDQLSVELTKGKGLGLADMLVRQLRQAGATPAAAAGGTASARPTTTGAPGPLAPSSAPRVPASAPASAGERASFISQLWPEAQQAAQQLGVHPVSLVAQAALETNWGRSVPRSASGASSNNLFGIKAGSSWSGASVSAPTQEFAAGAARQTSAAFRAYASPAAGFQDYVALLRGNPRFGAALGSGASVQSFAAALQQGGYATDPDYARKLTSVADQVLATPGMPAPSAPSAALKFAAALPIRTETRSAPPEESSHG